MDKLLFSILMGLGLAIIDIIPMMIKKLPNNATISAFVHYFVATIIIINIDFPQLPWWIEGGVLGFVLILPMLIAVSQTDKKALPIITANAIILGSIAEIATHFILK